MFWCYYTRRIGALLNKKTISDRNIQTYKVYLLEKGHHQTHNIDYVEIVSPFMMVQYIRNLLTIVACHFLYGILGIKTTFLNGWLLKDVQMIQSEVLPLHKMLAKFVRDNVNIHNLSKYLKDKIIILMKQSKYLKAKMNLLFTRGLVETLQFPYVKC